MPFPFFSCYPILDSYGSLQRELTPYSNSRTSPASLIEAGHLAAGFHHFHTGLQVIALVAVGLTPADTNLGLHLSILPVKAQEGQGKSFLSLLDFEFEYFAFVHQEAPRTLGLVLEPLAGGLPGLHIAAVKEKLAFLHTRKGIGYIHTPLADRFDLRSAQLDSTLMLAEDFVIPAGFLITGNEGGLRGGFLGHKWKEVRRF